MVAAQELIEEEELGAGLADPGSFSFKTSAESYQNFLQRFR